MDDPDKAGKAEGINQPERENGRTEEGQDARVREDSTAGTQQTERPQPRKPAPKQTRPSG